MDIETIIDTQIKPQLIETFGRQTANSLLTRATLAYVSTDGTEPERFEVFVKTISSDQRVLDTWGRQGTAERVEDWHLILQDAMIT